MSLPKEEAWFAAKRCGYGWGLPKRWQGWLVFGAYGTSIIAAAIILIPTRPVPFAIYIVAATAVIFAIYAWKGETTKWRWGSSRDG